MIAEKKPAGFGLFFKDSLALQGTLADAVSRAKVFANDGKTVVIYELVEVYRVEPTNVPNVTPPTAPGGGVA